MRVPIPQQTKSRCPRFCAIVESLEWRRLLSAFYDYDVLASTGDSVGGGFTIASFNGET